MLGARKPAPRIDPSAYIHPSAYVHPSVVIGPNSVIGPGAVIGWTGFGYSWSHERDEWLNKPHEWSVMIEGNVHVGANTCIDRGSWRNTLVREGTRIDNLVHIAHNVEIGRNCMIVAGAELSGSVVVGDGAWIGPNACVRERLEIGADALIGIGAVVVKNVPPHVTVAGNPARILKEVGVHG